MLAHRNVTLVTQSRTRRAWPALKRMPTMTDDATVTRVTEREEAEDDAAEIRYSLTALGEALVVERARTRFRGFGPCSISVLKAAG